jgi:hypothetical protein
MLEITATCQTDGCQHKGVPSVFVSDVLDTMCAACNQMITDITTKEIVDGPAEETE